VAGISSDLRAVKSLEMGVDITQAQRLMENFDVAYMAATKRGAFDIPRGA
jgi:hypothetical protein